MAEKVCPKCGEKVLGASEACPFCGSDLQGQKESKRGFTKKQKRAIQIICAAIGIVVAACVAFVIILMNHPFEFAENEDGTYTVIHCNKYVKKASIPETYKDQPVTKIDKGAFVGCEKLVSVEIPNSITAIEDYAFEGCVSLADIMIPNSVTKIGYRVFEGCVSLTSVTIPNSVTKIGFRAFGGCTGLTSLVFEGNSHLNFIDVYAFEDCPLEFAVLPTASILAIPKKQLREVTITSGSSLDQWAFASCKNLETVTIGDTVATIGDGAFEDCKKLKTVIIGNSVRKIDDNAFSGCTSLTSVIFGDKNQLTSIGEWAFYCCESLASIKIPRSVTSIGCYAFADCTSLAEIKYNGSEMQWYWNVDKGERWDYYAGEYTVTFAIVE